MAHRRLTLLAAAGLIAVAGAAAAQPNAGTDRRLDRMERDLKTLQSIIQQGQATGQPVVVRPEGPDPAMVALQARADDLEATLQRINGQVETLGHDLEQARRNDAAAETDRRLQLQQMNERMGRIEAQLANLGQAASAADPSIAPPEAGPLTADGGPAPRPRNGAAADATGRAQAGDTGVLGRPGPPPAPPGPPPVPQAPATPAEAFARARVLFADGKLAAAADAFQDFISRYPTNPRAPEAYYWMGESFYGQRGYQNATAAYAAALKSRPTTAWAPTAMVRLSQSLLQGDQLAQACAALREFDQRYAAKATAALKSNADAVRRRAACS